MSKVKNFGCVFSRSNTILAISQEWVFWLMWNENEVHRLDTGYDMWPWPLTSLITLTLDVSRSNFQNSCITRIVGLIDVKWKGSELIGYWADYMTLTFDHTHYLDLGVSGSKSEIASSQEWDSQLTWNEKNASHQFMTMILTSVTMLGWADVPDSDWGDFRHRHAIDISSCTRISSSLWGQWVECCFDTGGVCHIGCCLDDVMTWKCFPHYWSFVRRIHQKENLPVTGGFTKGQLCKVLMFSLLLASTSCWTNSWFFSYLGSLDAHVSLF